MHKMNHSTDNKLLLQCWEFQYEIQVTLMAVCPLFNLHDLLLKWGTKDINMENIF